jgi:hypothetical protein
MLLGLLNIFLLWQEEAPFRERSGGGLAAIGLTIGKNSVPSRACRKPLTQFSYTDTDLDPYNAERGFWWVSGGFLLPSFPGSSIHNDRLPNLVSCRVDARKAKNQAWTS